MNRFRITAISILLIAFTLCACNKVEVQTESKITSEVQSENEINSEAQSESQGNTAQLEKIVGDNRWNILG